MPVKREKLIKSMVDCEADNIPLSLYQAGVDDLNALERHELYQVREAKFALDKKDFKKADLDMRKLKANYTDYQNRKKMEKDIFEGTMEVAKIGFEAIYKLMPISKTPVGYAVVKGTRYLIDKSTEKALQQIDSHIAKQSAYLVKAHFRKVREQSNMTLDQVKQLSPEKAKEFFFSEGKGIADEDIDFLKPGEKNAALQGMMQLMEDNLTAAIQSNWEWDNEQQLDVERLKEDVRRIDIRNQAFEARFKDVHTSINSINNNVSTLQKSITSLSSDVENNADNISFLAEHVFNGADTAGKIALLEKEGLVKKGKERAELQNKLKALKAKEDTISSVNYFMNQAAHVGKILGDVGFDDQVVSDINQAVSVGNAAMQAFTAYTSGNPIAAVSAVSGLFGGGGSKPDPAAAMFQQVMKKLAVMDKKLDKLLEGQQTIIEGIAKIMEQLQAVSEQIMQSHEVQMKRFQDLDDMVSYNRFTQTINTHKEFAVLENFSVKLTRSFDGKPVTLRGIRNFYISNGRGERYEQGRKSLPGLLLTESSADGGLSTFLHARSYEGQFKNESQKGYYRRIHRQGYDDIVEYMDNFNQWHKFEQGLIPFTKISHLKQKLDLFMPLSSRHIKRLGQLLRTQISATHLIRVVKVVQATHLLEHLRFKNSGSTFKLRALEDVFATRAKSPVSGYLEDLLLLLNIAIYQENLFSGDVLIPTLYEKLFGEKNVPHGDDEHLAIIGVLKKNSLLMRNFANYFVYKQLSTERKVSVANKTVNMTHTLFEYDLYLKEKTEFSVSKTHDTNLRGCFDAPIREDVVLHPFKDSLPYEDRRWKINLYSDDPEAYMALPTYKEYNNGQVEYRPELQDLLQAKQLVIDLMADYDFNEILGVNTKLTKTLTLT